MHFPKEYVIYDFETTGLDTSACDVIEIGAMRVIEGRVIDKKEWLIKIQDRLPEEIVQITRITDDLLAKEGIDERQAFHDFAHFASGAPLVGHNILRYDNRILNRFSLKHGLADHFMRGISTSIDTAGLFKAREMSLEQPWYESLQQFCLRVMEMRSPIKFNLSHAYRTLGFKEEGIQAHRAGGDVEMVKAIYEKLTA